MCGGGGGGGGEGGGEGGGGQCDKLREKLTTYKIRKKQDSLVQFSSAFKRVSRRSGKPMLSAPSVRT